MSCCVRLLLFQGKMLAFLVLICPGNKRTHKHAVRAASANSLSAARQNPQNKGSGGCCELDGKKRALNTMTTTTRLSLSLSLSLVGPNVFEQLHKPAICGDADLGRVMICLDDDGPPSCHLDWHSHNWRANCSNSPLTALPLSLALTHLTVGTTPASSFVGPHF